MMPDKVNLAEKFARFSDYWNPRIVGELNGQMVKLAKLKGDFLWHRHAAEDELFLVVKGALEIRMRDGVVRLNEGEFYIVARGVEHQPFAAEEAHVLFLEPATTVNTGDLRNERTRERLERL
jgi:mannose-6-phosphate isomerase-like protein (cupin superfamily)